MIHHNVSQNFWFNCIKTCRGLYLLHLYITAKKGGKILKYKNPISAYILVHTVSFLSEY